MVNPKVFVLLTDGVGLKNFVFSKFPDVAKSYGLDVVFWTHTPADLSSMGLNEIKIQNPRSFWLTDILKNVSARRKLIAHARDFKDEIYREHIPQSRINGISGVVRKALTEIFSMVLSEKSANKIMRFIESRSTYYDACVRTLSMEKPLYVFSTNQRQIFSIAPVEAAKQLGIPCGTFIFSWDNLPKATVAIEPDDYFVWSDFMKEELLKYYPGIKDSQIQVTGTPQFENHFQIMPSREEFFKTHGLDLNKKYICYSGDDLKTSPHDPQYLKDVADAIRMLNGQGYELGIIFRRCPVDSSDRFDEVLAANKDLIIALDPIWRKLSTGWNGKMPTSEDMDLQAATLHHCEMVINLGSSMVFDAVAHEKPCAYMNYDPPGKFPQWSVKKIYRFIHFSSMPSKDAVVWMNSKEEIASKVESVLKAPEPTLREAHRWFEKIVQHRPQEASERICQAILSRIK